MVRGEAACLLSRSEVFPVFGNTLVAKRRAGPRPRWKTVAEDKLRDRPLFPEFTGIGALREGRLCLRRFSIQQAPSKTLGALIPGRRPAPRQ
jgi:hypothetical protein